jgi:catechol 2,3-dioxygenase
MMPILKPSLHHVTIKTSRLDEMVAWYALVVGAQVQFKDKVAAWMTNDGANHRLGFLAVPGLEDGAKNTSHRNASLRI